MDVCCLSRPFDDQSQDKVRVETEAVISLLKRCNSLDDWSLVGSNIITLEASRNPDNVKKQKLLLLHEGAAETIGYNDVIKTRAKDFEAHNVKPLDSLHLASAEYAEVDVLLTTDAKFIKAAYRTNARIRVVNPLTYYLEVLDNE
jgi:predicted nucleic acid-binding protein